MENLFDTSEERSLSLRLAKGLGFELRTLLNGLVGPIQLLKYKIQSPDLVEVFRLLDSSVIRLERTAIRSHLLALVEANGHRDQMAPLDLADLIRFSILEVQPFADLVGASLRVAEGAAPIQVVGHKLLLLQAFGIAFENAIAASGQPMEVEVHVKRQGSTAVCTLHSDTAVLPAELATRSPSSQGIPWDVMLARVFFAAHRAHVEVSAQNPRLTIRIPSSI